MIVVRQHRYILMNEYLSNYSVISLYSSLQERQLFLSAQSLIKNKIFLAESPQLDFQNTLFFVQTEGNNMQFSSPIQYEQSVYFRHKISRKYLRLTIDEEEERDTRYKVVLGSQKHSFKFAPCYQYQTKISSKIKFNQEVFLRTEYASSRQGTVLIEDNELLLGFNQGSKLQLHLHSIYQKEEKRFKHGRIVWLSHIESDNFLGLGTVNNKDEVVFQPIKYDKQIQDLKALWTINSNNLTLSNDLKFDEEIRLKNLFNGQFLCFSRNYKLVDNERIYQIFLEQQGSDFSKFMLRPIKEVEKREIEINSYMSLLHAESGLFLGCRKEKVGDYFKLLTFSLIDDEDLFKINGFGPEEEQALRFIFIIRKEFKEISGFIGKNKTNISLAQMRDIYHTYVNVLHELTSLKKFQKLYEFVKNQLGSSIRFIAENLSYFRSLQTLANLPSQRIRTKAGKTIELSYQILFLFCENHNNNQNICYQFLREYMPDIGLNLGTEELLIQTFRNNKDILPLIKNDPLGRDGNLVRGIFDEFLAKNRDKSEEGYWGRVRKVIKLLNTFIFLERNTLDINQYLIGQQLFHQGAYEEIFIPIRIQGQRILLQLTRDGHFQLIENIKSSQANLAIDAIFDLFSNLVDNHSINSKTHIHNYLAEYNQACLTILIGYLNRPIRKELYSTLLNFIARCYVDSAPRLKRHQPMSFIFFNFQEELTNVELEQAYYSERLREMFMLKAQESRVCKPLHYSNCISIGNISQPSITEEQLVSFRLSLTQKILNSSTCSLQQMQTVGLLMRLQCYTTNEMLQLYDEFKTKLITHQIQKRSIPKLLQFFQQVLLLAQELEIKKLKLYLMFKFQQKENLQEEDYKYVLPLSSRVPVFMLNEQQKPHNANNGLPVNQPEITHRSLISKNYISDYNELRDTLELMQASPQLKLALMDNFCSFSTVQASLSEQVSCEYLSSVFNMLVHFYLPKYEFLKLVTKSTILTHQEVAQFDRLFQLSKKLQYLVFVSENWLLRDSNQDCARLFLEIMNELIGFMFQGSNTTRSGWDAESLQTKKQLLMGNLGVHRAIFQLLEKTSYLLKIPKKQLKKKHKEVFQISFDFIYWLIKQCSQNKHTIYEYVSILLLYQNSLELGQTKTYTQFYRDEKDFAKEINFAVIQSLIGRIIRHPSIEHRYDECEYNPDYINVLIVLIQALDIQNKFFIEKLHKYIIRPEVFHRLLFIEQAKESKHYRFNLKLHRLRLDPIQIPIFYHLRVLELFHIILLNCSEVIKNSLKLKLSQMFEVEYLLGLLVEPDVYTNSGIAPQLNFLLKEKVINFLMILLEKSDSHSQLYESDALLNLLEFYSKIFLKQADRRQTTNESQSLFIPYLNEYSDYISTYQHNRGIYYIQHIAPLIAKLVAIFEKQPLRSDKNRLKDYLFSLAEALKDAFAGTAIKRATTLGQHGLKEIKLKWRNFVDDDEDNSQQQKFAKKTVLDILKSKPSKKIIESQLKQFYSAISKRSKQFVKSIIKLLTMLFSSRDISDGRKKEGRIAEEALKYFSGYIEYSQEKESKVIIELLQKQGFIEVLLNLTSQKEFQLSKIHLKNIFYHCLRILNFLLQRDKNLKIHRVLLKRFNQRLQANKFLEFLKEGALEVIASVDSHHFYEQINVALQQMRLCADSEPIHLFQESFHTLTLLCKHEPFTNYLRKQQSQFGDIDFLDKIYNILGFLFNSSKDLGRSISISSVRAAQYILDFISSMLTGRNATNQNFVVDYKYTQFVHQVLKMEKLEPPVRQPAREELLVKIVEFYHSNGIEISDLLQSKIKLIDFRELYLLNRFKYILVKTLLQCTIGNLSCQTKIKIELPAEIVKLNFIWVYESYKKCGAEYKESYILKEREKWLTAVERIEEDEKGEAVSKLKNELFLRLGFYFYQLIQIYQRQGDGESTESEEKVVNEEKEKERVVRKFFLTIRDSDRSTENQALLNSQKLGEQMKLYFHTYYNALLFFQQKTRTIQVNIKGDIIRTYFPRLPLAEKITDSMKAQFKQNAVRISRDQKIKSLFQWQSNFYEDLKGQDDFFNEIEVSMPMLGSALRIMQHQSEFLLIGWLSSLVICFAYLIQNMQEPKFQLISQFFSYISYSSDKPIHTLMLVLSIINLLVGLVIGFYLFARKIPLLKRLLQLKYEKMKLKGQVGNKIWFVWSNIIIQTIYNLYIVIFLCLTILHPFFSAFPLIEIVRRIEMGRFIIRSLRETWSQLFVTVGLLVVFNILYVQLAYEFFNTAPVYGPICKTAYTCMLLFNDQNLKAGQGLFGVVQSDYKNMVLTMQVLYEIFYILISLKVIFQIFSGTIIDKFSELREQEESIADDENKVCFICGQERFDLDLEYEGFQVHTQQNHNALYYMEYLFYLRRCQTREYGIVERYVTDRMQNQSEEWIPELDSLYKQEKSHEEEEKEETFDVKDRLMKFCKEKSSEVKRMHQKVEVMLKQLGKDIRQNKNPKQRLNQ